MQLSITYQLTPFPWEIGCLSKEMMAYAEAWLRLFPEGTVVLFEKQESSPRKNSPAEASLSFLPESRRKKVLGSSLQALSWLEDNKTRPLLLVSEKDEEAAFFVAVLLCSEGLQPHRVVEQVNEERLRQGFVTMDSLGEPNLSSPPREDWILTQKAASLSLFYLASQAEHLV